MRESVLEGADRYSWLQSTISRPSVARTTLSPDADYLPGLDGAVGDAPVDRLDLELALAAFGHDRVEAPTRMVSEE